MKFSVRFLREDTWPDNGLPYYEALEQSGVSVPAIHGLSERPRAAVLTLNDDGEFHRLLTNGFTFRTQHVQVAPVDRRTTTSVHVFIDAEVEDEDLQRRLESFGTVVGPVVHKYDSYKGHRIDAGIRYVNMILKEVVPNFVEVKMSSGGKATCRLWHNGQVTTCRACNKEGHIARNCPSTTEPRRNSSNPWAFRQHENENESRSKEDENESRNKQDHSVPVRQEQEAEDKETKENSEKETQQEGNEEGKEKLTLKKKRRESQTSSEHRVDGKPEEEVNASNQRDDSKDPWMAAGLRPRRTRREYAQDPKGQRKAIKEHH